MPSKKHEVYMPDDLWMRLGIRAAKLSRSRAVLIRRACERYLAELDRADIDTRNVVLE